MKNLKSILVLACALVAGGMVAQSPASYVPKVYPQQQETVGQAALSVAEGADGTEYTFSNNVLSAKFVKSGQKLTFGGSTAMNLLAGTELFTVKFGDGTKVVNASEMTLGEVKTVELQGDSKAVKGAPHFDGKQLQATFTYKYGTATVTILWTAELRDGSHYLKTGVQLSADKNVKMFAIVPMQYNVDVKASGVEAPAPVGDSRLRGRVVSNGKIFACLDTPTAINTAGSGSGPAEGEVLKTWNDTWEPASWKQVASGSVPQKIFELAYNYPNVLYKDYTIEVTEKGAVNVEFHYGGVGNHGLNIVGVELIGGGVTTGEYHHGFAGGKESDNVYSVDVQQAGTYTVRMYVENKTESIDSKGNIKIQLIKRANETGAEGEVVPVQGLWSRNTTLEAGQTWKVGSVVGLMAPEEGRRSVLAYLERERAVPWRPYPIYNSWYELNINRTNKNVDCNQNLKVEQTVDVMNQWKKQMFDKQGVSIKAFVWDDGWDKYGTWEFNGGFPNGFTEPDNVGRQMCSGQGAWLGPCGGYDVAGNQRKAYWTSRGQQCNLYNKDYYNVFVTACRNLCHDYDFRYFKFDGISALPTAYGPASGTNGEEDAEGIISVENDVRYNIKPDIFFNTTVGTWASPLWLNISDAVWRQEGDHGVAGTNSNTREQWITYRDNLVHQHFVQENPLMTINSMMTHGFILTNYGLAATTGMPRDYQSVLRELRCAFACGSGQVELYCDYPLMNSIQSDPSDPATAGALWKDLADLIKWQRVNADVLPDIHWVGNDPLTTHENVYGWAAWNGNKAVLTLRNGWGSKQSFTFTLREALNIPSSVKTSIRLTKSFADQLNLQGLTEGTAIDIDQQLTVSLPASSVYMFDGLDGNGQLVAISALSFDEEEVIIPAGRARAPQYSIAPLDASDKTLEWSSADETVAVVKDGAITGVKEGETTVTARTVDGSELSMSIRVIVEANVQNDLEKLIEEAQTTYDANETDQLGAGLITQASQFSSNATETKEGKIEYLIDGKANTFWHSKWNGVSGTTMDLHYLQVELPEQLDGTLLCTQVCRSDAQNDFVIACRVDGSTDGKNFTENVSRVTFSGVTKSTAAGQTFKAKFKLAEAYKHLRFYISETTNNRTYGHFAEFQLNQVTQEAVNSQFAEAAQALAAALTQARGVKEATSQDVEALRAAYDAYLLAIGKTPTGVGQLMTDNGQRTTDNGRWSFDLQGRRVLRAEKGLYIRNGRKVIK